MYIISFQELMDLNKELKKFGFMLILKDICSGQLVSIRTLDGVKTLDIPSQVYQIIEKRFKGSFVKIKYNEEKTTFLIQQNIN